MRQVMVHGKWPLILPEHRQDDWETWEEERIEDMYDWLQSGDVVFDVGAEEGDLPALWATWGCSVVCFEPNPDMWPNIRIIWEANDLDPLAGWFVGFASDRSDYQPVSLDGVNAWPHEAYEEPTEGTGFRHLSQHPHIQQITIDEWCYLHGLVPDALTIDTEGSEFRVLQGASAVLEASSPLVWVSIHTDRAWVDQWYDGFTSEDVVEWMSSLGYKGIHLGTDHEEHWRFWK